MKDCCRWAGTESQTTTDPRQDHESGQRALLRSFADKTRPDKSETRSGWRQPVAAKGSGLAGKATLAMGVSPVGFRFSKRIGIVPGIRLNLSKSGASVSVGERGAHVTIGRMPRVTVGLPGTGLSYTETMPRGRSRSAGGLLAFIVRGAALHLGAAIGLSFWAVVIHAYGG
jgi:hypothetical protein